jgi:hypothetical protein
MHRESSFRFVITHVQRSRRSRAPDGPPGPTIMPLLKREDALPGLLHADHNPITGLRIVPGLVELADRGVTDQTTLFGDFAR